MKQGLNTTRFPTDFIKSPVLITGFFLYGFSFVLWLKILKENELSYAFPVASAALFIFISLFSYFLLHEHLSFLRIAGMILIFIGILFVSRG